MWPASDVWQNTVARGLVLDLADRGVHLEVRLGRLQVAPMRLVSLGEVALLRGHRDDLIVLVLTCDDRTLNRLIDMRAGRQLGYARPSTAGHCHVCVDPLPDDRPHGRCGWCAIAARLYAGAPVPSDLVSLFPSDIRGPLAVPFPLGGALPFDQAVPA